MFFVVASISLASSCKKEDPGDGTKPEIVVLGLNPLYWAQDIPYIDPGAIAYDITTAGDTINLTNGIVITNNVDVAAIGDYSVKYNVADESGLHAEEMIRAVKVVLGKK